MATNTATKQPQLNKVDNLFLLNYDQSKQFDPALRIVQTKSYPDQLFKLYTGERLEDLVESIKLHGVMQPIIVRPLGRFYQILSGHNRVQGSQLAGIETIPAIILHDVSDEDANAIVIESNLLQRGFKDLSHSERAAVIALHHSKMFSQGKRNDILQQLAFCESGGIEKKKATSSQIETKLRSDEKVGFEYGLNRTTVTRYIRVFKLVDTIKSLVDSESIKLSVGATLSFLTVAEQGMLAKCIRLNGFQVTGAKADILREYSEKRKLNEEAIYLILNGEKQNAQPATRPPALRRSTIKKYFSAAKSSDEILDEIEKALAFYHEYKDHKEM